MKYEVISESDECQVPRVKELLSFQVEPWTKAHDLNERLSDNDWYVGSPRRRQTEGLEGLDVWKVYIVDVVTRSVL